MIVKCDCGASYNNQTVKNCPLCKPKKNKKQNDKKKERDNIHNSVRGFIREDRLEKRRGVRGSYRKVRTG